MVILSNAKKKSAKWATFLLLRDNSRWKCSQIAFLPMTDCKEKMCSTCSDIQHNRLRDSYFCFIEKCMWSIFRSALFRKFSFSFQGNRYLTCDNISHVYITLLYSILLSFILPTHSLDISSIYMYILWT